MWRYNEQVEPPAPFLTVTIHHPEANQAIPIEAKIDTGTDISAIPLSIIQELGLPVTSKLLVEGYDGVASTVSTYGAILQIEQARFRSQEFIAIAEPHALLGREILNHYYLLLNGPKLNFDLRLKPFP
jgi:predicted aspartyl protease